MKSRFGLILAVFCTFSAFAAEPSPTRLKLALNWKAEPEFGGFYAAKLGGAFKHNGLEVEVLEGGAGTPVVQMIATGKADFGISAADEVVISQERGTDVTALFAVYQTNPQGVMSHPSQGFKTLADLFAAPGTLAIQGGAPHTLYLKGKFPNARVKLVPYLGGIGNFLTDKTYSQQCFITSEPLSAKKKNEPTKTFLIADAGFNPYATVVVARRSYLEKNPQVAKAFVEAVRQGWGEYLKSPDQANQTMAKLNPSMDLATFKEVAEVQKPFILGETGGVPDAKSDAELGKMTAERWKAISAQLLQLKLIQKAPAVEGLFRNY